MDLEIGLDLDIDEYELTNFSNQQSSAPTSELGDAGSPSSSLLNEDLIQTNNINIILKQCNTTTSTSSSCTNITNTFFANSSFTSLLGNDPILPIADDKPLSNSKRGPGRPRKENPLLSFRAPTKQQLQQTKKKFNKDPFNQASYLNSFVIESPNMGFADESTTSTNKISSVSTAHNDELPYFAEKYPGKVCCLCNLCERSSLGQGDMLKITVNGETLKTAFATTSEVLKVSQDENLENCADNSGRKKALVAIKTKVTVNNECVNELDSVGQDEVHSLDNIIFEGCFVYIHSMCAMWSLQMKRIEEDFVPNFEEMVAKSITLKCSFCCRYGASVNCRMSCQNNYHLPCAAAAGCFLIIESFQAFCVEHISQVPYIAVDTNIECRQCCSLGDISKLIMCCSCGAHYHTNCIGLTNFPDSRAGWSCSQCCKCLICRQTENNENRSVKCEQCQKVYHTTCLRPIISSVPKYGWKCNRCRVCSDCGARTPGAGASSRWHCHYTICDSCYQQRNKGFSCPICHKAYRAASHKEMVKCSKCNKFVHSTCDDEADLTIYHVKKETNPDYDYVCQPCKSGKHLMTFASTDSLTTSADGFPRDLEAEFYDKDSGADFTNMVDPLKISKKRIGLKELNRGGKMGKLFMGKGMLSQFNRKRSVRGKGRQLLMLNASSTPSTSSDLNSSQCSEDDMALEKKLVLCSAKDKFILMQDICVMCGALGTDQEACLIGCVQCGQCYHPHCANVTLSKTMLQKGWRCLDCTVCEGCGQKNDEGRLILCDECDISYHIYCMSPPLDAVPNGNWKCKWCAICQKCGRNSPGKNSSWFNGFLECGPCASQAACFVCTQPYNENELIIQCSSCERWLHCLCDNIKNEDEAKAFNDVDYHCKMCRKDIVIPKAPPAKVPQGEKSSQKESTNVKPSANETTQDNTNAAASSSTGNITVNEPFESTDNTFWIDGVCVSEQGFNMIRSLTTEIKRKRKLRTDAIQKDSGIMSSIDSVIAGNSTPTPGDVGNDGNTTPVEKVPTPTYKDGMVWLGEDGSQPEGFSISTNEEGLNILRKKRQRNLQKLGIGGFNVRMRGIRKENEELYMGTLENPSLTDEKKKKIIKKKMKSKLCESYPSYLQEAFFGKPLLDNKESSHISFEESDESDTGAACFSTDNYKPNTKEPNITTSTTAAQIPNQQQTLLQQVTENKPHVNVGIQQKLINDISKPLVAVPPSTSLETEQSDLTQNMQRNVLISSAKIEETLKAIKTEDIATNMPTDFITGSTNNIALNSIKMEMGGQYNVNLMQNNNNNMNMQHIQQSNSQTQQQAFMPASIGINSPQQLQQQQTQQQIQHHLQQQQMQQQMQQQQHMQQQQQIQQQRMQYQQTPYNSMNIQNKHPSQYLTQKSEDPMLSQIKVERDVMLTQATATSVSNDSQELTPQQEEPVKETAVAGTQKTAEKMRKDEDLGEMATISAVLYANTQHPELKHLYPNWNERCKQILKKWRSLSTEMKAPFLQHAKDNRSVLRLRRSQQEPEKMYFQQKSLKEQEQERVWKQHQAKNKETYTFMGDYSRSEPTTPVNTNSNNKQTQPLFDMNLFSDNNSQNKLQSNLLSSSNDNNMSSIIPNQLTCDTNKSLSQLEQQQASFMSTLNQTMQQHQQQPSIDAVSKVFDPSKADAALQLSERNDIFLSDKNWPGVSKLTDSKDPMTSGVEKLEADENAGLGDILGGFADGDDDDILKSLTAEIGDDFNILEYADPELDEFNGSQNLLNKLDFDENQKTI
ncbi:histone-lysine N-methyltransferase 2C isoform X2 [Calliphora vicina]|uniref:histone-lysine N-methyltransferase 2C isoform X2 n=1 Tax=Calliphora vicina TaxID=7373 RepID=UPI00325AEFF6